MFPFKQIGSLLQFTEVESRHSSQWLIVATNAAANKPTACSRSFKFQGPSIQITFVYILMILPLASRIEFKLPVFCCTCIINWTPFGDGVTYKLSKRESIYSVCIKRGSTSTLMRMVTLH